MQDLSSNAYSRLALPIFPEETFYTATSMAANIEHESSEQILAQITPRLAHVNHTYNTKN